MKLLLLVTFGFLLGSLECHKIMVVFPMASTSHHILGTNFARGLAEAGNDVTFVSPYEDKTKVKNGTYKQIVLPVLDDIVKTHNPNMFENRINFDRLRSMASMFVDAQTAVLNSTQIKSLVEKKETFDVVILEEFSMDALKALPVLFNAHFIAFSPIGVSTWINELTGNPTQLAYMPEMNTGFPQKMPFFTRVLNVLVSNFINVFRLLINHENVVKSVYPSLPPMKEYKYNCSLMFLNSNPGTLPPYPIVPSMIPVGGYHVQKPQPLPKDLQDYLDNSPNGVIYFSMGSVLKSKNMPREKVDGILNTFRQLKQNVLWKWEEDNLEDKPDNVKIQKWMPQSSILAHPNVKLFITHGGLLSTTETIYHGKPVLAIPIFGDQPNNAQQMVNSGFARKMNYDDLTSPNIFLDNIKELLENKQYYDNAQTRSRVFHDLPMKPMDSINFWVDYVVRHKGAKHLRVASLDLHWYQIALLDVWAFIIGIVATVLFAISWLIKKRFCGKCKATQNKKLKTQ